MVTKTFFITKESVEKNLIDNDLERTLRKLISEPGYERFIKSFKEYLNEGIPGYLVTVDEYLD